MNLKAPAGRQTRPDGDRCKSRSSGSQGRDWGGTVGVRAQAQSRESEPEPRGEKEGGSS